MRPKWVWLWYAWCIMSIAAWAMYPTWGSLIAVLVLYIMVPWLLWKAVAWIVGMVRNGRQRAGS